MIFAALLITFGLALLGESVQKGLSRRAEAERERNVLLGQQIDAYRERTAVERVNGLRR